MSQRLVWNAFFPWFNIEVFGVFTWRMVVSVSSWISRSSEMLLTMSQILLYSMTITRCLCVEHFARFALELSKPPEQTRVPSQILLCVLVLLIMHQKSVCNISPTVKFNY